mgnify:CR=1 FL=1
MKEAMEKRRKVVTKSPKWRLTLFSDREESDDSNDISDPDSDDNDDDDDFDDDEDN